MTTTPDIRLRTAMAADQEFMDALYYSRRDDLQLVPADAATIRALITMQQQMQALAYQHAYPLAEYLIVEAHGEPVGRIVIDHQEQATRLVDFAILPMARRQGYALAVLRQLQQSAAMAGRDMVLSVAFNNPGARQLYIHAGFEMEAANQTDELMRWRANK